MQHGERTVSAGERTMWMLCLRDAYLTAIGQPNMAGWRGKGRREEQRRMVREDRRWFLSESDEPGSYLWLCSSLGIDPDAALHLLDRQNALSGSIVISKRSSDRGIWAEHYADAANRRHME